MNNGIILEICIAGLNCRAGYATEYSMWDLYFFSTSYGDASRFFCNQTYKFFGIAWLSFSLAAIYLFVFPTSVPQNRKNTDQSPTV